MLVALASSEFSTSSLTTAHTEAMTCELDSRCTVSWPSWWRDMIWDERLALTASLHCARAPVWHDAGGKFEICNSIYSTLALPTWLLSSASVGPSDYIASSKVDLTAVMAAEEGSSISDTLSVSKGCFLFNPPSASSSRKKKASSILTGEMLL